MTPRPVTTDAVLEGPSVQPGPTGRSAVVLLEGSSLPLDTSVAPAPISHTAPLGDAEVSPLPAGKPLLASEALMEDLAPVEPARRDARVWCAACGGVFLGFGALPLVGVLPGAFAAGVPWLVTGSSSLVAAVVRFSYRQRALAMLGLGLLTALVALQGSPALVRAEGGAGWGLARLVATVSLTAALVFRARYRAYAGARVFLGTGLILSIPITVHIASSLALQGFGPTHVGAIVVVVAILASLSGFMGAETTGAGSYMAPAVVAAFALELGSRGLATTGVAGGAGPLVGVGVGAAGFGAAAGFTAFGLFQILASRFAEDARRINLHPGSESSRISDVDPPSEWSTRD